MAHGYRLWVERAGEGGPIIATGLLPLPYAPGTRPGESWDRLAALAQPFELGGPWALLLAFLDLHREAQPVGAPFELVAWMEANKGIPESDWATWKAFAASAKAPYLATWERGHPMIWYPGTDGEWYGFLLLGAGSQSGWNWWVPGTERYFAKQDGGPGFVAMQSAHRDVPANLTMRDIMFRLPQGLFEVQPDERLSLLAVLDEVLSQITQDEAARARMAGGQQLGQDAAARARIFVYEPGPGYKLLAENRSPIERATGPTVHYGFQETPNVFLSHDAGDSLAVKTLDEIHSAVAAYAWTWLTPVIGRWNPMLRADWGIELNQDPNLDKPDTADRLVALTPREKFARTCLGTGFRPAGGDPFGELLGRIHPVAGVHPDVAERVLRTMLDKARDAFWLAEPGKQARRLRREQTDTTRQQLVRRARMRQESETTDLFAAVAQQIEWAVEAGCVILACPHPGCGRAFLREHRRQRYCPEHRSNAASQQRSRRQLGGSDSSPQ